MFFLHVKLILEIPIILKFFKGRVKIMLLGAAALLFATVQAVESNDTKRKASETQLREAEIRKKENDAQRKHETTMAVLNSVFGLIDCYANSATNQNSKLCENKKHQCTKCTWCLFYSRLYSYINYFSLILYCTEVDAKRNILHKGFLI